MANDGDLSSGSRQWQWAYAEILAAYLQREFRLFRRYSEGELAGLAFELINEGFFLPQQELQRWIDVLQANHDPIMERMTQALYDRRRRKLTH